MKKSIKCYIITTSLITFNLFASNSLIEVKTPNAPNSTGPFSQAIRAGDFLYISGQLPIDPITNQLTGNTIEEQTTLVLNNIEAILKSQGLSFANVVKAEVYLKDMNDFQGMNTIYAQRFSQPIKPTRQAMQVVKLPLDALIEISCIAFKKE